MSSFRLFATPLVGDDIIATATLEPKVDGTNGGSVQVWSIGAQAWKEFETVLDFGGQRLALCGSFDRMVVVAGACS